MSTRTGGGRHATVTSRARRVAGVHAWVPIVLLAALIAASLSATHASSAADPNASRFVPWLRAETPALSLRDPNGRAHALDDFRGKVVLLNFWATWCEPCKDEMPSIVKLKQSLAGRPFEVLAVNFAESPSRVREFLVSERLDLIALLDPNKEAARAWRVRVLPASFLVGPDGRVRYSVVGELDWSTETAMRTVQGLLPPR
jgi:cytochrome c biogenesis protein CcmG, thiol:disulfide interchange protein DsbE